MQPEISVRASDSGTRSRAFLWPVLESGNSSYENGVYSIRCENKELGKSFLLHHSVENAPLLQKWADSEQLFFVCTVASPRSMYRILKKSSVRQQPVQWDPMDLGEHPMFTPMLVTRNELSHVVDAQTDGINQIWHGKKLCLPKGARVAVGPSFKFQSGITGILDFNLDKALSCGQLRVEPSSEDGFKFKVHLAKNLYDHLVHNRQELVGGNIMVHIVSVALGILKRDYDSDSGDEGWQSYPNLDGLAEMLDKKGLGHWTDDEFKPELAATILYPHKVA